MKDFSQGTEHLLQSICFSHLHCIQISIKLDAGKWSGPLHGIVCVCYVPNEMLRPTRNDPFDSVKELVTDANKPNELLGIQKVLS